MKNRIEEVKLIASVLLEEIMKSEVAADMVALKIRQRLNAHGYGKLPQPLDDKGVKEKALSILEAWQDTGTDYIVSHSFLGVVNEIYSALLQPKIEEAKREERERIIKLHICSYTCRELYKGMFKPARRVVFLEKDWQALKGGE